MKSFGRFMGIAERTGIKQHHYQILGAEPYFYVDRLVPASDKQTGADKDDERYRYLSDDKGAAQIPTAPASQLPSDIALQGGDQIGARRQQGWRQAEDHYGRERNADHPFQDVQIGADIEVECDGDNRMPISLLRAAARASVRLATFAQATSNTNPATQDASSELSLKIQVIAP